LTVRQSCGGCFYVVSHEAAKMYSLPFVLSLSKHHSFSQPGRKERPFDKLRANGVERFICDFVASSETKFRRARDRPTLRHDSFMTNK